jgi:hypothetical protein
MRSLPRAGPGRRGVDSAARSESDLGHIEPRDEGEHEHEDALDGRAPRRDARRGRALQQAAARGFGWLARGDDRAPFDVPRALTMSWDLRIAGRAVLKVARILSLDRDDAAKGRRWPRAGGRVGRGRSCCCASAATARA